MRRINLALFFLIWFPTIAIGGENDCVVREKHYPEEEGDFNEQWQEKKIGDKFIKDGFFKAWYGNGNVYIVGQYKNGQRDGKWIFYDRNKKGQIVEEQFYKDGAHVGEWRKWKDGKVDVIIVYENRKIVRILVNEGGVFRPMPGHAPKRN